MNGEDEESGREEKDLKQKVSSRVSNRTKRNREVTSARWLEVTAAEIHQMEEITPASMPGTMTGPADSFCIRPASFSFLSVFLLVFPLFLFFLFYFFFLPSSPRRPCYTCPPSCSVRLATVCSPKIGWLGSFKYLGG